MKRRKNKPKFKTIYEYVPSPDGEKRLAEAYGIIFDEIEKMIAEEKLSKQNIKKDNTILKDKKSLIE